MSRIAYAYILSSDLIKADTPLTTAKISRMLHQLDFKLTVEKQYKEGIDKMAKLYQVTFTHVDQSYALSPLFQTDGDKKSRSDAESKRLESTQKLQLLNQAIKKYKSLDIMGDESDDEDENDGECSCRTLFAVYDIEVDL